VYAHLCICPSTTQLGTSRYSLPSLQLAWPQLCHQPSSVAASRGSLGSGTAVRWVPPELAKELVEREDFVLHHTYEVVPTETRTPPYQTRSMSLLPMFGQAVRRTASVLPSCPCCAESLGNLSSQDFNIPLLCEAC